MELRSWQTPDFDLTSGKVDHSKSYYYKETPGYSRACLKLWELLGTNQIIWCFTDKDEHRYLGVGANVEWVIDVPRSDIKLIDTCIWEKIIGSNYVPHELELQWRSEARKQSPYDKDRRKVIEDQKRAEYLAPVPEDELWSQLFLSIDDVSDKKTTAIILHPIQKGWVVDQVTHTTPMSPIGLDYYSN